MRGACAGRGDLSPPVSSWRSRWRSASGLGAWLIVIASPFRGQHQGLRLDLLKTVAYSRLEACEDRRPPACAAGLNRGECPSGVGAEHRGIRVCNYRRWRRTRGIQAGFHRWRRTRSKCGGGSPACTPNTVELGPGTHAGAEHGGVESGAARAERMESGLSDSPGVGTKHMEFGQRFPAPARTRGIPS